MFGHYFYHKTIHKIVTAFGTLFNDIQIRHYDESGNPISVLKVPLAYGPTQKFLSRIDQQPEGDRKVAITLPRMSFEMTSIDYDPQRKSSVIQTFSSPRVDSSKPAKVYSPAPYNIQFELNIMSKLQDDVLQIVEQILPFFQPSYNVSVKLLPEIQEVRDLPVILNRVGFRDDYENDFKTRRIIMYTLTFTVKGYLFGEVPSDSQGLIKKVQVDYATDAILNAKREVRYTVTPKALQDYNADDVINASDDPLIPYGDDFGFNEELIDFQDFKDYSDSLGTDV